ncbi:MAG TPA: hypothetical protein PKZ12_01845 [Smithellaceae bacterium]|nr:hypothetical protein [Smithellaceae bacterium]
MNKLLMILTIVLALLALIITVHYFRHETIVVGKYTVVYYPNQCKEITKETFPHDFESLKDLPCLIRITWQERVAPEMFEEYCYLPGREIEKSRVLHKKE